MIRFAIFLFFFLVTLTSLFFLFSYLGFELLVTFIFTFFIAEHLLNIIKS